MTTTVAIGLCTVLLSVAGLLCRGAECQQYQPITGKGDLTSKSVKITKNVDNLWWFNGCTPQNYPVQCTLTANVQAVGDFKWYIPDGAGRDKVAFSNGSFSITQSNTNTVVVHSTAKSGSTPDVEIKLEHPVGSYAGKIRLQVLTVDALLVLDQPTDGDMVYGYSTEYHYQVLDQRGQLLPSKQIYLNEWWDVTNALVRDEESDWPLPDRGAFSWLGMEISDEIALNDPNHTWHPQAQTPGPMKTPRQPLSTEKVDHWTQYWHAGSQDIGEGELFRTDVIQRYLDHARVQ